VLTATASEGRFTAQTSAYGRPIPIVFGTQRIGGNIILAGTYFTNQTDYAGTPTSAGLVQLGLCEGPIDSVTKCWVEKTVSTPGAKGWTIITGARTQSPWAALAATNADIALGYSGTALVCDPNGWAQSAVGELEKASYVVIGLYKDMDFEDPNYPGAYDATPYLMVEGLLNDADWGLDLSITIDFGGPLSGPADTWWRQVVAGWMAGSLAVVESVESRELLAQIFRSTHAFAVWSEGSLKLKPMALESIAGSFTTYTPNVTPLYDLGSRVQGSDFLADEGESCISVERPVPEQRFNCFPIEYTSRSSARVTAAGATLNEPQNEYRLAVFDGEADPTDAAIRGVIKSPVVSLPCITRLPHAKLLSRLMAAQSVARTSVYRFRLGWRWALLEVGDLVTLSEENLGLSRTLVRITEIREDDGDFGLVAESVSYKGTVPAATYAVTR
jgi:hypothetical protein